MTQLQQLRHHVESLIKESKTRVVNLEKVGKEFPDIESPIQSVLQSILAFLDTLEQQENTPKPNLVEELNHYFATTTKEQQDKDWEELKEWNEVGPDVFEYLKYIGYPLKQQEPEGLDEAATKCAEQATISAIEAYKSFKADAEWRDTQLPKYPDNLAEASRNYVGGKVTDKNVAEAVAFVDGIEWAFGQFVPVKINHITLNGEDFGPIIAYYRKK